MPSRLEHALSNVYRQQAREIMSRAGSLLGIGPAAARRPSERAEFLAGRGATRVELSHWTETQVAALSPYLEHAAHRGVAEQARLLANRFGPAYRGVDMRRLRPKVRDEVNAATSQAVREGNATVARNINAELRRISRARKRKREPLTDAEALAALRKVVAEQILAPHRPLRFAETETHRVQEAGRNLVREQSGAVWGTRWKTNFGPTTCKFCISLNGKAVALGKPFAVRPEGGPYAVVTAPPDPHPHCACETTDVFEKPKAKPARPKPKRPKPSGLDLRAIADNPDVDFWDF